VFGNTRYSSDSNLHGCFLLILRFGSGFFDVARDGIKLFAISAKRPALLCMSITSRCDANIFLGRILTARRHLSRSNDLTTYYVFGGID
jgi:hypothetical protein